MDLSLEDIIGISLFQNLLDRLNSLHAFPSAIIDNNGRVLDKRRARFTLNQIQRFERVVDNAANDITRQLFLSTIHLNTGLFILTGRSGICGAKRGSWFSMNPERRQLFGDMCRI